MVFWVCKANTNTPGQTNKTFTVQRRADVSQGTSIHIPITLQKQHQFRDTPVTTHLESKKLE